MAFSLGTVPVNKKFTFRFKRMIVLRCESFRSATVFLSSVFLHHTKNGAYELLPLWRVKEDWSSPSCVVAFFYGVAVYLTSPCCSLQTQQALSEHHSIRQQLKQKPLEESESSDRLVYQWVNCVYHSQRANHATVDPESNSLHCPLLAGGVLRWDCCLWMPT